VATVKAAWAAISVPQSQVSERRRSAGKVVILAARASATAAAARRCGRAMIMQNRVVRSAKVATALWVPAPMIRSPSQWPGTARSAASAGRALMLMCAG